MKAKLITPILVSIFFLFSCSNDDSTNQTNEVNIRLSNNSTSKFENATFDGINFGDIEPGGKTAYKKFAGSYSYGSVKITINGKDYQWIPYDYVGEELLEKGSYTFEYNFDNEKEILTDELIKD